MTTETREPSPPETTPETTPAADDTSLADHEAQFGRGDRRTPRQTSAEPPPAAEGTAAEPEPAKGARDPATGKFVPQRHRAKSQQASPDDAPRISELTRKLREAEEKLAAKEAVAAPPAAQSAAAQPSAPVVPQPQATARPKPQQKDFKTFDDYLDARDAYNREQWQAEERVKQDNQRIVNSWRERSDAAMQVYPDFEDVALKAPSKIPAGSLMDAWILESANGALVLYEMQKNEAERARIAGLPPVQQAEALAVLGYKLSGGDEPAPRKKAPAAPLAAVPRPPTPVKTGAIRQPEEAPGDDASLAEHEKAWGRKGRHR